MYLAGFLKLFYELKKLLRIKPIKHGHTFTIVDVIDDLPWNTEGKWGYRPPIAIKQIIVHQAMSKGPTDKINAYHISKESHLKPGIGAPHIAYTYTVEKDGTIYQCNLDTALTWHTRGQNTKSIGICLIGDFNGRANGGEGYIGKTSPSKPQLQSLNYLLNRLMSRYELQQSNVYGHCDFGKPACPGNKVQTWLEQWKSKD
jgi:hypothetical protein